MPSVSHIHCLLRDILSFSKYLLSSYYVPGALLGARDMVVNKTADRLPSGALYSSQGREITNNQKIVNKSRSINALWKK